MLIRKITFSAALCAGLLVVACGQKGALYLPTEPEAVDRATLPQTLVPPVPKTQQDKETNPL